MSNLVEVRGLCKRFGDLAAVDNISFSVAPGTITGLIGPNGAGKTTALKALLGLGSFSGEVTVLGQDPRQQTHHLMRKLGFIADAGSLPRWMRVKNLLAFVRGVHPEFDPARARELLRETDIRESSRVRELSKGMTTQLHLAIVLATRSELLVLDEPTLGLDILVRKQFYERLQREHSGSEAARSIIISTHQVEEVEDILTHLLFINRGRIVLDCAMSEIRDRFVEVAVEPARLTEARALGPIHEREAGGRAMMIFESDEPQSVAELGDASTPTVANLFVAKASRDNRVAAEVAA